MYVCYGLARQDGTVAYITHHTSCKHDVTEDVLAHVLFQDSTMAPGPDTCVLTLDNIYRVPTQHALRFIFLKLGRTEDLRRHSVLLVLDLFSLPYQWTESPPPGVYRLYTLAGTLTRMVDQTALGSDSWACDRRNVSRTPAIYA